MIARITEPADINIDTKAEEVDQLAQIWRALNARALPCLVILDNFPENSLLQPCPPTGRTHTIITIRRQNLAGATVRLPFLTIEESVRLLNSGERQFGHDEAAALAERLGGLPPALELAKCSLNYRQDLTVPALLDEMNRAGEVEVLTEFTAEYRDGTR